MFETSSGHCLHSCTIQKFISMTITLDIILFCKCKYHTLHPLPVQQRFFFVIKVFSCFFLLLNDTFLVICFKKRISFKYILLSIPLIGFNCNRAGYSIEDCFVSQLCSVMLHDMVYLSVPFLGFDASSRHVYH